MILKRFSGAILMVLICQFLCANTLKCDKVIAIESTELLSYLGNVTFNAPGNLEGGTWTLYMKTNIPFTFIGGWNVGVKSDATTGKATFHSLYSAVIRSGEKITFRFRIHYSDRNVVPHVKSLQWEKWTLCDGTGDFLNALQPTTNIYNLSKANVIKKNDRFSNYIIGTSNKYK